MRGAKRLRPGASRVMRTKGPGEACHAGQGTGDTGKKGRGQGARGGWFNPVPSASAPCVIHAALKRFHTVVTCTGMDTSYRWTRGRGD